MCLIQEALPAARQNSASAAVQRTFLHLTNTNLFPCHKKSTFEEKSCSGVREFLQHVKQARVHSLYLPVPLWCTVGNTEIKCRSEVDDEALSAGGHFQSLEYIPLLYSQTSCIRETPHLPAHPLAPQAVPADRGWAQVEFEWSHVC